MWTRVSRTTSSAVVVSKLVTQKAEQIMRAITVLRLSDKGQTLPLNHTILI